MFQCLYPEILESIGQHSQPKTEEDLPYGLEQELKELSATRACETQTVADYLVPQP